MHMAFQQTRTQGAGVSAVRLPDVPRKLWRMWVTEHRTQATQWIPFFDYERAQQMNGALVEGHQGLANPRSNTMSQ